MQKVTHSVESLFATQTNGDPLAFLLPDQSVTSLASFTPMASGMMNSYRTVPSLPLLNQYFKAPEAITALMTEHQSDKYLDNLVEYDPAAEEANILKQLGIGEQQHSSNNDLSHANVRLSRCVSYKNGKAEHSMLQTVETVKPKHVTHWNIKILWQKLLIRWF